MNHHRNRNSADSCGPMRIVCARLVAGARNTLIAADSRPESAALSRPDSDKVMGGMRTFVRRAARLQSCFEHPAHPLPVERLASGLHKLMQEPETMTTHHAAPCGDLAHALPASATRTAAPSSYHPHALRAPAFELVTGGAQ